MAGRKRTSDDLKLLKGTHRKDRESRASILQSRKQLEPPPWLPEDCKQHFQSLSSALEELGLNSSTYGVLVSIASIRLGEISEINDLLKNDSLVNEGANFPRSNPLVKQRAEALRHLQSLLSEFGLTPTALSRIVANRAGSKGLGGGFGEL